MSLGILQQDLRLRAYFAPRISSLAEYGGTVRIIRVIRDKRPSDDEQKYQLVRKVLRYSCASSTLLLRMQASAQHHRRGTQRPQE